MILSTFFVRLYNSNTKLDNINVYQDINYLNKWKTFCMHFTANNYWQLVFDVHDVNDRNGMVAIDDILVDHVTTCPPGTFDH